MTRAEPRKDREANHGLSTWPCKEFIGSHKQHLVIGVTDGAGQPAVEYLIGLAALLVPVSRIHLALYSSIGDFFQALC